MAGSLTQQTTSRVGGSTSLSLNLTGVASGSFLVLHIGTWNHVGASGTVAGGGATWTRRINQGQGSNIVGQELWEGVNSTGGSITVTWTRSGAVGPDIAGILTEWGGMPTSSVFDVAANTTGTGTSPDSGLTATTAQADEVATSICTHEGGNITMDPRAGDGYTELTGQENGSTGAVIGGAYKILSATGQQQGRFTLGSSQAWEAGVSTFKATGGGGGATAARRLPVLGVG